MKRLAIVLVLAAPMADAQESSCTMNCHGKATTAFGAGIHANAMGCVTCHGGDPTALRDKHGSHSLQAGFRGTPSRVDIPQLCGGCHSDPLRMFVFDLSTDQLAHYLTSAHGKAVAERGDTSAAVCTDCHGTHDVLPSHDPAAPTNRLNQPATCARCHSDPEVVGPYGLPTDIVERFSASVHGEALLQERLRGAPACADCHGAHGTAPPGVEKTILVCAHCHANTGEEYRKSPHFASDKMNCSGCHEEADKGVPGFRRSGCTACHGAHAIQQPGLWMFEGKESGRCLHCHPSTEAVLAARDAILGGTEQLRQATAETLREIHEAKDQGLFLEHEQVFVRESQRTLVSVQPLTHSLDVRAIQAHFEDGIKRQDLTREQIRKKRNVARDRKILFGGAALVLLMLTVLLRVKLAAVRRLS